ncbi:MAG: hypothetical protein JWP87_3210 [Labilithrix sp.]|nr:hypothetical protein [Labilithrix sp.]
MRERSWLGYVDRMKSRVLPVAWLLASLFLPSTARAETHPVLVIGGGAPFRDALTVALSPWDLRVVPLDSAPPRPVMPRAADEARALARDAGASGVVWVAQDQSEPSLWVYDASTDQVVTRKIATAPPFDAPTAAAAALSVKTLLRSSTVAPPAERIGAPVSPPSAPAASPSPSPPSPVPPSTRSYADANGAAEASTRVAPMTDAALRVELEGAGRAVASQVDARLGAGLSAWIGARRNVGLAVAGTFGPGLSIDAARFSGRFVEVAVSPSARFRLPVGRHFVLEPRLGMSLHSTSIDGVAVLTARTASTSRLDASVDGALAFEALATRTVGIAVDVGATAMLRYQRYIVESDAIFELHPVQAFVGLRLTTSLL